MHDPDDLENIKREPLEGDGNPAAMTAAQATKCADIIDAYEQGHVGMKQYVPTVVAFLHAAATEGRYGSNVMRPSTSDLWPVIDAVIWAPIGRPKPQQDVD